MKSSLEKILKAIGKTKASVDLSSIHTYVKTNYNTLFKEMQKLKDHEKGKIVKGYMKSQLDFYGIKLPVIHKIIAQNIKKNQDFQKNFLLSEELIKSNIFELKIGGIDILTLCSAKINIEVLNIIRQIIKQGHIQGWGLCDSLALPLKRASIQYGPQFDDKLIDWKYEKQNDWVRRTALVTFVKKASHGDKKPNYEGLTNKLLQMCDQCVQYDNRFNQLGVGWLLREISITQKQNVKQFIFKHYDTMSREGIRYAIQKMSPQQKQNILKYKIQDSESEQSQSVSRRPKIRSTRKQK